VGLLSNLLGLGHHRDPPDNAHAPVAVRRARGEDLEPAMRLILAPPGAATADARSVNDFIAYSRERGVLFDALHVATRHDKVASAILPVISPGRTALLLAPAGAAVHGPAAQAALRALVDPVCRFLAGRDVQLAQALSDPQDAGFQQAFVAEGFDRMAELYYLQVQPPDPPTFPQPPPGTSWVSYDPSTHATFGRAIIDSYRDSLDCPALNGRRDVEDIIAGHKASGTFDPALWFVLRDDASTDPLGVLLLGQSLRGDSAELVYLGLSPAARGRKLGELMMRQALAAVASRQLARLSLAVDALNTPALKLYYRHGMQRVGSKVAFLRDLRNLSVLTTTDVR
jgi:ribosomal protein S18 acetylase RimI-like enzyme